MDGLSHDTLMTNIELFGTKAHTAEAEREGWLGEVEGLRVSLAGAAEEIAQLDARQERRSSKVFLRVPSFDQIGA
jgi:hypothetical protein